MHKESERNLWSGKREMEEEDVNKKGGKRHCDFVSSVNGHTPESCSWLAQQRRRGRRDPFRQQNKKSCDSSCVHRSGNHQSPILGGIFPIRPHLQCFFFFLCPHSIVFFFVCVFLKRIIKFPISFFLAVIRERESVFCWTAETTQV